nr:PREDICTED: lysozyme C, milk isozyme-like [Haliaeetus albicilla]
MGSPLLLLLLVSLLTTITKAKAFSRCEPAHVLQEEGLDGYGGYSLASREFQSRLPTAFPSQLLRHSLNAFCPCPGLCVAFNESIFNTAAQSIEADGGADYSIFQISSQLWCIDDRSPSDNHCRMACRDTTALLPQSQPQEWRQQPEPSSSAQLHPLAKMEPWRHEGPNLGNPMPVATGNLLLSNVTGDIICAKRIVRNPQGMNAWEGWAMHCKGQELSEWVEGCDL